jgi:hypothetical protein
MAHLGFLYSKLMPEFKIPILSSTPSKDTTIFVLQGYTAIEQGAFQFVLSTPKEIHRFLVSHER